MIKHKDTKKLKSEKLVQNRSQISEEKNDNENGQKNLDHTFEKQDNLH